MNNRDIVRQEDILVSNRRLQRHIYNINLYRYINQLHDTLDMQLQNFISDISDNIYHTIDFLHGQLEFAIQFWHYYRESIIQDVSIYNITNRYFYLIQKSFEKIINIHCDESYVYYLYEKSIQLYNSMSSSSPQAIY